jgi:CheY-like chemotaxis protein
MALMAQPRNILIVEDDPDIREGVAELLVLDGYEVAMAANGLEGLHLLAQLGVPCLILLDMMMPVMDGPEFLARVKADPVLHACTVMIMTASHVQLPPGAAGLLRKPFELPELLAAVRQYCT